MNICQSEDDELIEELLKSDKIWYCGQCFSWKTRCPRGNNTANVILALRRLSIRHGYFAESEKGRQQLFAKRVFGENMLKRGYTLLAENITPAHFPELGENWEYYYEHREEMREWWDVPMNLENSPGSHRAFDLMCSTNLELRQPDMAKKYNVADNLPILYITEIIGLALGIKPEKLGMNKHIISPIFWLNWVCNPIS